jgi:hypothetical protein
MKTCTRCHRDLELRAFRRDGRSSDGREKVCAKCKRAEHARRMQKVHGPSYVYHSKDKLPDYSVLKALYVSGVTYPELAALYHVRWASVQAYLKRQAVRHGDPWPFDRPRPRRRSRYTVDGAIIADLIRQALKDQGISARYWSHMHGVGESTVSMLLRRTPVRLRLYSAKRLLVALGEPVPQWMEDTLRDRAKIRSNKSAAFGVSHATDSGATRNLET